MINGSKCLIQVYWKHLSVRKRLCFDQLSLETSAPWLENVRFKDQDWIVCMHSHILSLTEVSYLTPFLNESVALLYNRISYFLHFWNQSREHQGTDQGKRFQ